MRRRRTACTMALAGFVLAAAPAAAQRASAYLPLDDAAYAYVDALVARGRLRALPALERPYRVDALRAAMAAEDTVALPMAERRWLAAIEASVARIDPAGDEPRLQLGLAVFATGETSARRELMLGDAAAGLRPGVSGRAVFRAGPVVAVSRQLLDQRLRRDPDFRGRVDRAVAGRTEDAYVEGQWRWASVFFGRQRRSWGPSSADGLLLGSYAFSWDHALARLGGERVWLELLAARLDPYAAGADSGRYERHVAMHRLGVRAGGFDLALAEAVVYGGVGRGTELPYLNPLTIYQLSQYNETSDGNVSYTIDASWRSARLGSVAGQLLIDDFQIDRCEQACAEPPSYGATLQVDGVPLAGAHRVFAAYTRVSNLAYRPLQPWERHTSFAVGLGRGYSDYDETRVGVELGIAPLPPIRAYVATRRQGEGDYRLPFPPLDSLGSVPAFLSGAVTRTTRLGVSGGYTAPRGVEVAFDAGWNLVRPAGGTSVGRVEARIRGTWHLPVVHLSP